MHRSGAIGLAGPSNRRPRHGHGHGKAVAKDNALDISRLLRDPSPDHQPESAGSLRKQISEMLMKHHQLIERNNHPLQPPSPASYQSSLEVARYDKAVTPSRYNLKTSTELLKVLNRIWSLEEQNTANISLIKSLKSELSHSRARIKELLRYQELDRHELDDLVKEKMLRKSKEVDQIRKELENERKVRKRFESLNKKLSKQLSEVKSTVSNKSKKMLENLCDEFAKGIKGYEDEIRGLKLKKKDWISRDKSNQMILEIAESWIDERMQKRLEGGELIKIRRNSVESVPFIAMSGAPKDTEDSVVSDLSCLELKKVVVEESEKVKELNKEDLCDEIDMKKKLVSESCEASCSYSSRRQVSPVGQWSSRMIKADLKVKSSKPRLGVFKG